MNRTYLKALAELVLVTYGAALLALLTADGFNITSLSAWKEAAIDAVPTVLVVLYGVVARFKGNYASPLAVDTTRNQD